MNQIILVAKHIFLVVVLDFILKKKKQQQNNKNKTLRYQKEKK